VPWRLIAGFWLLAVLWYILIFVIPTKTAEGGRAEESLEVVLRVLMVSFLLNLPYTLIGLVVGLFSGIQNVELKRSPTTMIIMVQSFWWARCYLKGARAVTMGHVVLLSPKIQKHDLEHELVHVRQHERLPFIFPFLYFVELLRKGYHENKYEKEARQGIPPCALRPACGQAGLSRNDKI